MPDDPTDDPTDEPTADDATDADTTAVDASSTDDADTTEPQAAVDDPTIADPTTEVTDEPVAASAASAANGDPRPGVFIPRGVAILLGVLLLIGLVGGGGFALGRSTADDDGDRESRALPFGPGGGSGPRGLPNGNGNGNNGNNGGAPNDGRDLPFDDQPSPSAGAFLGVRIDDATGDVNGAQVLLVASGSPAEDAGLETGDVITQVDGDEVLGADDLVDAIAARDSGDTVTITFVRDGDTETVEVELVGPSSSSRTPSQPSQSN